MSALMGYDARKKQWTRCTASNPAICTNHSVHQGQKVGLETISTPDGVENPYASASEANDKILEDLYSQFKEKENNLEEVEIQEAVITKDIAAEFLEEGLEDGELDKYDFNEEALQVVKDKLENNIPLSFEDRNVFSDKFLAENLEYADYLEKEKEADKNFPKLTQEEEKEIEGFSNRLSEETLASREAQRSQLLANIEEVKNQAEMLKSKFSGNDIYRSQDIMKQASDMLNSAENASNYLKRDDDYNDSRKGIRSLMPARKGNQESLSKYSENLCNKARNFNNNVQDIIKDASKPERLYKGNRELRASEAYNKSLALTRKYIDENATYPDGRTYGLCLLEGLAGNDILAGAAKFETDLRGKGYSDAPWALRPTYTSWVYDTERPHGQETIQGGGEKFSSMLSAILK